MVYVVVAYDIPSDKRRTRLAKTLLSYGERTQWSVFEARLTRAQYASMRREIQQIVDTEEDVVTIYFLTSEAQKRTFRIGNVALPKMEEPDFV